MSMKKWRKLVSEKAKVEQQNDNILTAIKNNKIDKEFSLVSGEELFKPITSRLEKLQEGAAPKEEKEEVPDYGMEEFDLNNPFDGYVVKSKKSKFYGYTLADIKEAREEILDRRKGNKQPAASLHSGVNPTVGVPLTPKETPQDESDWEVEGSGSVDPNALVERLHLSLASIQAGNTSLKLKKQVKQILGLLVRQTEITQKQTHKILSNII